ncbi:MAG TPA: response regulator [Allosphingosinicella sp.]
MQVWLYEDDADVGDWVKRAKSGYRPWARKIGKIEEVILPTPAAFEKLLSTNKGAAPDLIVVDLEIEGEDHAGVEAIKSVRARSEHNDMPIVVFSSNGTRMARESAYEAGATSYVKKPAHAGRRVDALADIFGYWLELNQARG